MFKLSGILITMLLILHEQSDKIHATIKKHLLPIFKDQFEEGSIYVLEKFMVAQNDPTFKTTDHKYKLSFMAGTNFFKVNAKEIPERVFCFMSFNEILAAHRGSFAWYFSAPFSYKFW